LFNYELGEIQIFSDICQTIAVYSSQLIISFIADEKTWLGTVHIDADVCEVVVLREDAHCLMEPHRDLSEKKKNVIRCQTLFLEIYKRNRF
jgi:predicted class III extradiol MEMO1 family dioxygenase